MFKAELRAAEVDPRFDCFEICRDANAVTQKISGPRGLKLNRHGLIDLESLLIRYQTSRTTSFKVLVFL